MDDEKLRDYMKKAAEGQLPDAWGEIERRLQNMEQQNGKKNGIRWGRAASVAAAACAVVALAAVAVFAKPGLLSGTQKPTGTPAATVSSAATAAQTAAPTAPAVTADPAKVREPVQYEGGAGLTASQGPTMKIMVYADLASLAQAAENIAEFKFVRQHATIPADDGNRLYTDYEMQVTKVFKGNLKPGDKITLHVFGGASDKVWIEDNFVERLNQDFDYVLFVAKFDDNGQSKYQLTSSFQGYVPLQNGLVSLNTKIADNGLYTQGEALADLEARIQDAVK